MIDRRSLAWRIGSRLAGVLIVTVVAGLAGLVWHTHEMEAEHNHEGLVHDVIAEFFVDLAWGIPIMMGVIILVGAWTVRRTMAPLRAVADAARDIGPSRPDARLPTGNLPSEALPLVEATNDALGRLQGAYAAQQRFIANAAHELRTPVAVFRAAVERLPGSQDRDAILADVERLSRLIGQLLDLARMERGEWSGDASDAGRVAREVAAQLAPVAAARDVGLAIDLPAPFPFAGDAESLTTILRNLTENAIHHSPAGTEVRIASGGHDAIRVEDRGPGVPADARATIFERFSRGSWTTCQGSGLGLSIAREAARRIGATIRIEDNEPNGARFVLEAGRRNAAAAAGTLS